MVQRKSFIISTLIILVLIVIGFNIPNIIKVLTNGEESSGVDKYEFTNIKIGFNTGTNIKFNT